MFNRANRAEKHIDLLVYAAVFLHEQHPLRDEAEAGCKVRVALGDPECEQVRQQGAEEQFGRRAVRARGRGAVQVALMQYRPLLQVSGVAISLHRTTLYDSIYRFDDEMVVNLHVWGANAYRAPALHLRRLDGGNLFRACFRTGGGVAASR